MIRTWKLVCLPAMIAAVLTAAPVPAADPELKKSDTKQILEMMKQLTEDMKQIKEDNVKLLRDLNRQQDDYIRQQRLSDIRDDTFEKRLQVLENKLADLE